MIINGDKQRADGAMHSLMQRVKTDVPILLLSRSEDLDFNEDVLSLKNFVVCDVIENGWNWDRKETLVVGRNTEKFFSGDGWGRMHDFLSLNKPKMYLKRELLSKDATDTLLPIEYPNWQPRYDTQTEEEFNNRRISVMNYWGRSHEARLMIHGEIWKHAARKGYAVCDNMYYFQNFMAEESNLNIWLSFWIPHYNRIDISEILKVNGMSKFSISLPGCGVKCFRSTGESIVNSIAVMPEDELAYSYNFYDEFNCIKFPIESVDGITKEWKVCERIEEALKYNSELYPIYLEGLKAAEWYQVENYISNYLEPIING